MSTIQELEKIVIAIASTVVDTPQALVIVSEEKTDKILFVLSTRADGEIGQLIGERGIVANSMRVLIRAASRRLQTKEVALTVTPEIETRF